MTKLYACCCFTFFVFKGFVYRVIGFMYCCLPATFKHAMSCLLFIQKEINNSRESIFNCKTKLSPNRKMFPVCFPCARLYSLVTGLILFTKRRCLCCQCKTKRVVLRVLDVESVEHQGQVRKLLLTKEGTVFKVRRSKPKNIVKPGQYP